MRLSGKHGSRSIGEWHAACAWQGVLVLFANKGRSWVPAGYADLI